MSVRGRRLRRQEDGYDHTLGSGAAPGRLRARRLRRRLRGGSPRRAEPRHRRHGDRRAGEPRPSRRRRRRGELGRRRGDPRPGARRLPARFGPLRASACGRVRRGHGLPAGSRRARPGRARHRGDRRGRRPPRSGMAHRARRPVGDRAHGAGLHADVPPAVRRRPVGARGSGPGARGLPCAQARGDRRHVLRLAVLADPPVQGDAHHDAARALLPRSLRSSAGLRLGHRALALLHQHVPFVAARPALPHGRPQRRDQHRARQPQLDGRPRGQPAL